MSDAELQRLFWILAHITCDAPCGDYWTLVEAYYAKPINEAAILELAARYSVEVETEGAVQSG